MKQNLPHMTGRNQVSGVFEQPGLHSYCLVNKTKKTAIRGIQHNIGSTKISKREICTL